MPVTHGIGIPDIAALIAHEHQAVFGVGILINRPNRRHVSFKIVVAQVGNVLAQEHAAAGKIAVLTDLPGAGQDRHGPGAVIEPDIGQRMDRIENIDRVAGIIRAAEQDQRRLILRCIILRRRRASGDKGGCDQGAKAQERGEHGQFLSVTDSNMEHGA